MLSEVEVLLALCWRDPRHPAYAVTYSNLVQPPSPREDCSCDNCINGRDSLAQEILRLRKIQPPPVKVPKRETNFIAACSDCGTVIFGGPAISGPQKAIKVGEGGEQVLVCGPCFEKRVLISG